MSRSSYRPDYGSGQDRLGPPPREVKAAMYHFQGNRDHNTRNDAPNRVPRRNFTFRPPKAYERPLLTSRRNSPGAITFPSENTQDKFRDLDELTESDETDMDLSDSEDPDDRPSKRVRVDQSDGAQPTGPKWSNPDPYTALPPTDESSSKKKKDVVKLIRKARNNTDSSQSAEVLRKNEEDFISFDFEDEDWNDPTTAPLDAPSGPRFNSRANGTTHRHLTDPSHESRHNDNPNGKRKRDEDKPSAGAAIKRGRKFHTRADILRTYEVSENCDPCPWFSSATNSKVLAGVALHKEIVDFYDWVRPQEFEVAIRADLVSRLNSALNRLEQGELKAFGSYAAGLYLPTGDMDLVYLQGNPRSGGRTNNEGGPAKLSNSHFRKYRDFLHNQDIAKPGSIMVIPRAKVQIIKFVDRISDLKVDLCFNNTSGLTAIDTFHTWNTAYPAMPIIVSIIKQYLMIRGLNDVSTGGLGGFSIICLVTSLIQHLPLTGHPQNLGHYLLEFFNLYGNLFNRDQVAIRLDPPEYIDKASYEPYLFKRDQVGRLTIIDPNRADNNISGGTSQIGLIFDSFAHAHEVLTKHLSDHVENSAKTHSFLASLVGGDFSTYERQRAILRNLHHGSSGQSVPLPSTRLTSERSKPTKSGYYAPTTKLQSAERRSARLKALRPDLADKIQGPLAIIEAARLGGYSSGKAMHEDLERRPSAPGARKKLIDAKATRPKTTTAA